MAPWNGILVVWIGSLVMWRTGKMGGADVKALMALACFSLPAVMWGMFGIGAWGLVCVLADCSRVPSKSRGYPAFPGLFWGMLGFVLFTGGG
jgi:hypothetical protein